MRPLFPFLCLLAASCADTSTIPNQSEGDDRNLVTEELAAAARPVRIGELGPNFRACSAAGTTRSLKAGESLPVRWAPFESGRETGSVRGGARFFICTRSHDQKWFGIVHDESGTLAERCGVSEPVTGRRDYEGPCRSGWVQSAFVKVIAGEEPGSAEAGGGENVSGTNGSAAPGS